MVKMIGVVLYLVAAVGFADTVTVSWEHPTQYVDGAPLPLADIVSTEVECVSALTSCPAIVFVAAPAVSVVVDIGPVPGRGGEACFRARTHVAWDVSDPSAVACKVFPPKKPRAPGNVAVQ